MTNAKDEKRKIMLTLLAYWPIAGETESEMKEALAMFDTALEGISPRFVETGVKAFIQGRVATHNPSFRPKPSELASYVRPMQENETSKFEADRKRRLQIESRGREEPTPEDKARVQAALKRATGTIAEKVQNDMIQTPTTNK